MAVALSNASAGGSGNNGHLHTASFGAVSSITITSFQTISSGDTFYLVQLMMTDTSAAIGTMTVKLGGSAGTAMTQIGSAFQFQSSSWTIYTFGLVNPPVGSAQSLFFSWNGGASGDDYVVYGASFTGSVTSSVAAATYAYTTNNNTTANSTITVTGSSATATGDMAVAFLCGDGSASVNSVNNTEIDIDNSIGTDPAGCNRAAGAGAAITCTATLSGNDLWGAAIVSIAAAGATGDDPNFWKPRSFPTQWNRNTQLLLHRSPGPEFSIAPETNTHFIPHAFPPQWNLDRRLLHHRSPGPEFSIAPETNTHVIPHAFPLQWNLNRLLWIKTGAGPESSSAPETNPHWKGQPWPVQWAIKAGLWQNTSDVPAATTVDTPPSTKSFTWPLQWIRNPILRTNTAQDFSSSAVETNPHWVGKQWPVQWVMLLRTQNTAQDFSSSAVETNPHWIGKTWGPQWSLYRVLLTNEASDVPVAVTADTPPTFVPLQWESQWNVDVSWVHGGGNDESSIAPETNVHTIFKTWPVQWSRTAGLLIAPDTSETGFAQPETNTFFIPRTYPPQWSPLKNLQNTAQDFSSSAVETNPHWIGKAWPIQWAPAIALRTSPSTDVPVIITDTPPHTIFRTWLPKWLLNIPLLRGTAQDFSSIAAETNVHFIPRTWPPQWKLQASLRQGTAQDFSTAPPAFVEIYENPFFQSFARIGAIGRNP